LNVGDEIAVGGSVGFTKFWGYSAYNDTYYELEPEGNWVSPWSIAGGKTAIVIRTTKAYAFSPGNVNSIREDFIGNISSYSLSQNYPNPFNPRTTIKWQQQEISWATLKIFDVLGREVVELVNEELSAGQHEIIFDASLFTSGIYFYQLKAGSFVETKKMILIK
jgi:hypothetical protein